jgi:hypothetical protein
MEKEFVPYELALRMKQIGFDILTEYSWVINVKYPEGIIGHSAPAFNHNKTEKHISAPLYQQAFRWFRRPENGSYNHLDFMYAYLKDDSITYEEAELECLKKLIEIVEKELIN